MSVRKTVCSAVLRQLMSEQAAAEPVAIPVAGMYERLAFAQLVAADPQC